MGNRAKLPGMDDLEHLREEIGALDRAVLESLNRRLELVQRVNRHKQATGAPGFVAVVASVREVASAMSKSQDPLLADLQPVLAVPEFKVPLPGGECSCWRSDCAGHD